MPRFLKERVVLCFWNELWIAFLIRSSSGALLWPAFGACERTTQRKRTGGKMKAERRTRFFGLLFRLLFLLVVVRVCLGFSTLARRVVRDAELEPLEVGSRVEARVDKDVLVLDDEG